MKVLIVIAVLASLVVAAPQQARPSNPEAAAEIVEQNMNMDDPTHYSNNIKTSNGIEQQEEGLLDGDSLKVRGSFHYVSREGELIHVQYTADENGFQASGDHLPQPQEVPLAIQRSIQWNEQHPEEDDYESKGRQFAQ